MAYVIYEDEAIRLSVPLEHDLLIGSDPACGLVLSGEGVCPKHARLTPGESGWTLTPADHAATVLLQGKPLTAPAPLADGMTFTVGRVALSFRGGKAQQQEVLLTRPFGAPGQADDLDAGEDAASRLNIIYEVARAIEQCNDPALVLKRVADLFVDTWKPSRVLIAEFKPQGAGIIPIVKRVADSESDSRVHVSSTVIEMLTKKNTCFITQDALSDADFENAHSVLTQQIRSAMGAPIRHGDNVIGLIYVDDLGKPGRFSPSDLHFLMALSQLISELLSRTAKQRQLEQANALLREDLLGGGLVGRSPVMRALKEEITRFAVTGRASILIRGESGSGKELVARALHDASPRRDGPFVTINCAALPEQMIESELFGYTKGAFTGAIKERRGKFELADGGTLFLDEVADMSLVTQAKVLRALETGEVSPLGSEITKFSDCWVLSATHKDLVNQIERGQFRSDLYYRLNVVELSVPPLRDRPGDIPLLADTFLQRLNRQMGQTIVGFAPDAMAVLQRYPWPGNVRELRNEVERATMVSRTPTIGAAALSDRIRGEVAPQATHAMGGRESLQTRYDSLAAVEEALIREALALTQGNIVQAAEQLGISRVMLKTRIARFQLQPVVESLRRT